jgi:hypothetical protein
MSRSLLLGATAIALALALPAAPPARAQAVVPDASIEGPIQSVDPTPGQGTLDGSSVSWVGQMQVMGVTVRVLTNASINSPTAALTLPQVSAAPPLPGRAQNGFLGGTAIATGDSAGGILYATDVFVEPAENVIVGEATGAADNDVTVNKVRAIALTDPRIKARPPINGFGFEILPSSIPLNSLLAIEGYFGSDGNLRYHTLEADGGTLIRAGQPEVNVLRAQCRIRGGNRDELEVRGGTHTPANAVVTIQYRSPNNTWIALTPTVAPVVDNTVTPAQGLYRFNRSNLNFPGTVCPPLVRARITVNNVRVFSAPFAPDSR